MKTAKHNHKELSQKANHPQLCIHKTKRLQEPTISPEKNTPS